MRPMVAFAMCAALACEHPTEQKAPTPLLLSAIATGYYTTCGVGIDGTGYCWGNGRYGQLGFIETDECSSIPGEDPCAHTPHAVDAAVKFTTVAAGGAHFCAITTMADAYCWGSDQFGQLGTFDTAAFCGFVSPVPCARTPQLAYLPPPVSVISGGDSHTCAVVEATYCWGYGLPGTLGDGANSNAQSPRVIAPSGHFLTIAAGGAFSCAIAAADSVVYCWGANFLGQLGDATTIQHSLPQPIADTTRYVALALGTAHACGLNTRGEARCWGVDQFGELGVAGPASDCGGTPCRPLPGPVTGALVFTRLALGETFTCGATSSASYCWGATPGRSTGAPAPAIFGTSGVAGGEPFVLLTASIDRACGITAAHQAYCWGADVHGALGDGPVDGSGDQPVLVIAPDSTTGEPVAATSSERRH